jgi:transketolase
MTVIMGMEMTTTPDSGDHSDGRIDRLCIDTLRFLAVDAVEQARSGHPGLPLGAAPMAYVLWNRFLKHDPGDPGWWDRDRFVLSAGHGSALLYALLHAFGYALPLDELRRFRQWGSHTPGHPESHLTPGVEASTGPLGQGLGNAVGMAIGEAHLAARYNRPGHEIFHHHTFVIASDGDMMEGVTAEASSLAGHLRLGRLIVLYDNNHVTLSGTTSISFDEDVTARYAAYGWHVQHVADGNDIAAIDRAVRAAVDDIARPSLIAVDTVIGYGAPGKQGTFEVHGSPLGADETARAKRNLGWPPDAKFLVPPEAAAQFRAAAARGNACAAAWRERFAAYEKQYPELAGEVRRRFSGALPDRWSGGLPTFPADAKGLATRKASEAIMQEIGRAVPELVGGSGDLDPSTFTWLKEAGDFESPATAAAASAAQGTAGGEWSYAGRNIHFGIREHAMGAAINGLAYHGGFIPFGATFLVFSDYLRPPIRLAALSHLRSIFVFTHDSIGLGEDGPTHQAVEQLAALRAIPRLLVIRPGDANETRVAWQIAMETTDRPIALALTRQAVPTLDRARFADATGVRRGAYVLDRDAAGAQPEVILMATGSEVSVIVAAAERLRADGLRVRLVSMPCERLFEEQSAAYRESVLPRAVAARVAVEAGASLGWHRFVGPAGRIVAVDRFGASAPGEIVMREYGLTPEHVAEEARAAIGAGQPNSRT